MSEKSVFAVDRGIWDHPMFRRCGPFTEREAWLWLVSEAAWKSRDIFITGRRRKLERGQLAHSIRFLADKWGWHRAKVERFFHTLKTETMIETAGETGITVTTICNYDDYQFGTANIETDNGTLGETAARQQRDKEEELKNLKKKDQSSLRSDCRAERGESAIVPIKRAETPSQIAEREFYAFGKQVLGKSAGGLLSSLLRHHNYDLPAARAVLDASASKQDPREYVCATMRTKANGNAGSVTAALTRFIEQHGGEEAGRSYVPGSAGPRAPFDLDSAMRPLGHKRISQG